MTKETLWQGSNSSEVALSLHVRLRGTKFAESSGVTHEVPASSKELLWEFFFIFVRLFDILNLFLNLFLYGSTLVFSIYYVII